MTVTPASQPSTQTQTYQMPTPKSGVLTLLLNIIWLISVGFWMAVGYLVAGLIACLLIVTIPCGLAAFRMALFAAWPFGTRLERDPHAGGLSMLANVVWLIFFGWWLALGHIIAGIGWCLTIIGIPFGVASFKLVPVSLAPYGCRVVGDFSSQT